jgi:hypothetical protein
MMVQHETRNLDLIPPNHYRKSQYFWQQKTIKNKAKTTDGFFATKNYLPKITLIFSVLCKKLLIFGCFFYQELNYFWLFFLLRIKLFQCFFAVEN